MRENGKGSRRWFSVDSKSFEFSVEGEGRKMKVFITERRAGDGFLGFDLEKRV